MKKKKNQDVDSVKKIKDLLNINSSGLNQTLLVENGVTIKGQEEIQRLHRERESIFSQMLHEHDPDVLKSFAQEIEDLEFKLQKAWKFKPDRNRHTWWFRVPQCSCPKMDNYENVGTPNRIISADCPVHGK